MKYKRGKYQRRRLDRVRDYIKEKILSGEEVYDRNTWRHISSNIYSTYTVGGAALLLTHITYYLFISIFMNLNYYNNFFFI